MITCTDCLRYHFDTCIQNVFLGDLEMFFICDMKIQHCILQELKYWKILLELDTTVMPVMLTDTRTTLHYFLSILDLCGYPAFPLSSLVSTHGNYMYMYSFLFVPLHRIPGTSQQSCLYIPTTIRSPTPVQIVTLNSMLTVTFTPHAAMHATKTTG